MKFCCLSVKILQGRFATQAKAPANVSRTAPRQQPEHQARAVSQEGIRNMLFPFHSSWIKHVYITHTCSILNVLRLELTPLLTQGQEKEWLSILCVGRQSWKNQKITITPLSEMCTHACASVNSKHPLKRKMLHLPKQRCSVTCLLDKVANIRRNHSPPLWSPWSSSRVTSSCPRFITTKESSASGKGHSAISDCTVEVKHMAKHS